MVLEIPSVFKATVNFAFSFASIPPMCVVELGVFVVSAYLRRKTVSEALRDGVREAVKA